MRYATADEDSARWDGFRFRPGDLVVSSRSKHGTTWLQAILLLLIHRQADLPAPLATLSPWLDHRVEPVDEVLARLEDQDHRRVIKTHTPLDGVPADTRATYLVAARHPLDAALSLYHQGANIDRQRLRRLTGTVGPTPASERPSPAQWLRRWIVRDADARRALDSLPGVLWHLSDAWSRRHQPNVVLVHFDDLIRDLDGGMRRLARLLALEPPTPELVDAATLTGMRERASRLVPDPVGILRDHQAFFREGRSGAGVALLTAGELEAYRQRAAGLAPADLLAWLHR